MNWKDLLIKYSLFLLEVEGSMLLDREGETGITFTNEEREALNKINEGKYLEL